MAINKRMDAGQVRDAISHCFSTDQYYFNPLYRRMKYTSGVKTFATAACAHWLLDIIGTEFHPLAGKMSEEFCVITLDSNDGVGVITMSDGNGNLLRQRRIDYTDCPEGVWKFYLEGDVLLLPTEH